MKTKLFAASAFIGIALAVAGSIDAPKRVQPVGSVARVNGHEITKAEYDQALKAYAGSAADALDAGSRKAVLDKLIDERLLIDRAFALGLPARDAKVRQAILSAMQEFIVAEVPEPDDATLRAFYQAHQAEFTPPKQYAVRTLFVADSRDTARLGRVEAGLKARVSFAELASKEGQAWDGTPPKAALPEGLLVRKLGPSGAAALPAMKIGETMGPFEAGHGVYYLHLADVKALPAPAFEAARTQVLADWRRLKNADAMKAYIAKLRAKAEIDRQGGEGTAP